MNADLGDFIKRVVLTSVKYAGMAGAIALLLMVLSKIPVLGFAFLCVGWLFWVAAYTGIGYLVTPTLSGFPAGQSKPMIALLIGLGVALPVTIAVMVTSLVSSLIDWGTGVSGLLSLIFSVFSAIFGGLLIGTPFAFLGSYLAFDRNKNVQSSVRPF